jgi:hypothetical protein
MTKLLVPYGDSYIGERWGSSERWLYIHIKNREIKDLLVNYFCGFLNINFFEGWNPPCHPTDSKIWLNSDNWPQCAFNAKYLPELKQFNKIFEDHPLNKLP